MEWNGIKYIHFSPFSLGNSTFSLPTRVLMAVFSIIIAMKIKNVFFERRVKYYPHVSPGKLLFCELYMILASFSSKATLSAIDQSHL